jgi:hypothetical protein
LKVVIGFCIAIVIGPDLQEFIGIAKGGGIPKIVGRKTADGNILNKPQPWSRPSKQRVKGPYLER